MHANAQLHLLVDGTARILCRYRSLHRDGTLHGIDRAGEVSDHAVPGGVEDAATMRRDQLVDDGAASLQSGERAEFVVRHQPAIPGDVGGEDRGEFALYRLDRHAWLLLGAVYRPARSARDLSSVERLSRQRRWNLAVRFRRGRPMSPSATNGG